MTNTTTPRSQRELLEMTLEIYGADRTRWPVQRRHELSQFIAASEPSPPCASLTPVMPSVVVRTRIVLNAYGACKP